MVAIPTLEDEVARRPNRERGNLVTEQTRIVNQIKAILARFGIRTFRPTLRKAEEKLGGLRTADGRTSVRCCLTMAPCWFSRPCRVVASRVARGVVGAERS